jgi:hypothetical protein
LATTPFGFGFRRPANLIFMRVLTSPTGAGGYQKGKKMSKIWINSFVAVAASAFVALGASAAFADHFNANNYPKGWTSTTTTSTQVFQGYSTQPAKSPNGQGTSSITTTTTTIGPKGEGGKNNPHALSTVTTTTSGPGNSPSEKILSNQGRL